MIALELLILVPLALAVAAWAAGSRLPRAAKWVALLAPIAQIGLLASLAGQGVFVGERVPGAWGTVFWRLGMDGLSTPLIALTAFTSLVAVASSWEIDDRPGRHFGLLLLVQGFVSAVFLADNIVLFYIAWESVLVPMFLLIGGWGSSNARQAAMKFLVYTFAGGAVLLVGVIYLVAQAVPLTIAGLAVSADAIAAPTLVFWLLAVGFLVKLPVVPVHTWLPDAHTEAPTAGSIMLAGVLLKMGGYGLLRIAIPVAPAGFEEARPVLAALGVIGIVWGAATALVQTDLKRLVAYSSVAHMGFVVLAAAIGTAEAFGAAVFAMVSHGLVAGMLFFLVGALYGRAHTRQMDRFGGLGTVTPKWAALFVFGCLASAGLPGLSGFPGEFVTLVGSYEYLGGWIAVAGVGLVLAAAYNLRAVRSTVQGPVGEFDSLSDLGKVEIAAGLLFAAAIIALGVRPVLVTDIARGAAEQLAQLVGKGL